jgi:hypothetical protein
MQRLEAWLSKKQDPTTFAEQDFDTQMGWFADQIEGPRWGKESLRQMSLR